MTTTQTVWTPGPQAMKFTQAILAKAPDAPFHLPVVALHEIGHLTAAMAHKCIPCRVRAYIIQGGPHDGYANGDTCWRCSPMAAKTTPRQRAIISAAGIAAVRIYIDKDDPACRLGGNDLKNIQAEGFKPADVMRDACKLLWDHHAAIVRLTEVLSEKRELRAAELVGLLAFDPALESLDSVLKGK
jgi:hypothetical protein